MKSTQTDTDLLTTAVEEGYFRVPRRTTLVALADAHDISDVEASERLRAGIDLALREHLDGVDATDATDHE
ncbi:helix-turn-helix domain-containing protein [Halorientalis halophila]|uniref:helix-turn-helix domain-containing protein n=1 Tax=Halorientalis halophila TaxID=3108499 RepID=UPI003008BF77